MPNNCGCGTICTSGCVSGCKDNCGSSCGGQNSSKSITRINRVTIPSITKITINNEPISSLKTRGV